MQHNIVVTGARENNLKDINITVPRDKLVELAAELLKVSTGSTIYVLDEPTTGLHTADVHWLIDVLQALVNDGNTVVVIEHNLDVIKTADYLIDLGPEGGSSGGAIVCTGTPEQVASCAASYTGHYLKRLLKPTFESYGGDGDGSDAAFK